jgi:hypothetical protein
MAGGDAVHAAKSKASAAMPTCADRSLAVPLILKMVTFSAITRDQ